MKKIGVYLALGHLAAFLVTALYIAGSPVGQVALIWILWFPVDLPWSLLYFVLGENYSLWVEKLSQKSLVLSSILYAPHLIHGVIGTIWWYFLPNILKVVRHKVRHS